MVARIPVAGMRRRWPIVVVGAIVLVLLLFTALSGFFVDVLFFREVGFSDVFWGILRTKFVLALVFGLVFFAALYANLLIVRRITPRFRPLTLEQEILDRYRMAAEPYLRWLLPAFALLIALFVGLGVTSQWQTFLLWRNSSGVSFGIQDPELHRDVGFYVFSLPWLKFVQGWLFSALVGITVIVSLAHYLWGGIRPQAQGLGEKVTPQVKAHLSVLLGLILLVKAWGYYLGTFDLMLSQRGVVAGASYTDVKAQMPALRILIFIAVACAVLFFVNIRLRGWALPVIAVGLLALVSIVAGAAYPAFVQRFRVGPQELQKERPYIVRNIAATQAAFGLDQIETEQRTVSASVSGEAIRKNVGTISNIRLWRPEILRENYEGLQRIRQYYAFNDVDVDRYSIQGSRRVVMVSTREVTQNEIPGGGSWQNRHLVYTHGFGAVASVVNTATTEGAPQFTLQDIPPVGEPPLQGNGPRIYYGERSDVGFVLVNTGAQELDYQGTPTDDQKQVTFEYDGDGGIPIGGFLQRALFAWKFRDVNLLISGLVQGNSRIMINRSIYERVPKVAPFLKYDGDPYAAIVDDRLVWIWDAYTTTAQYPYSQPLRLEDFTSQQPGTPPLVGDVNYIRNSVKVVVDAYDGSLTFYVADPQDPIVQVWENAFPQMFTPLEDAPDAVLAHFRYPENLFQVQAAQYGSYHVTDPRVFYGKQDFWQIPEDPTQSTEAAAIGLRPYYMLIRPPAESSESFALIQPFTPLGRQNMVAWMAARSDPGPGYGDVLAFQFPSGENIDGPTQVFSRINQDARFSAERTLLSQGGSEVLFGDFLVIPIDTGLLYVQPVYVRSTQTNAIPELKRVVVVNGDRVGIGTTLQEALTDSLSGQVEPPGGGGGGGGEPPTGSVQQQIQVLLASAASHFDNAQEALRQGDLATYQSEVDAAAEAVNQANQLAAQLEGAAPTGTPTPSPSA
ncbi:MAG TPA: UPF0182 family protein [Actinomycetota bacterium]|nr:UPF0182 family protein [Actinomycetota bacterium]